MPGRASSLLGTAPGSSPERQESASRRRGSRSCHSKGLAGRGGASAPLWVQRRSALLSQRQITGAYGPALGPNILELGCPRSHELGRRSGILALVAPRPLGISARSPAHAPPHNSPSGGPRGAARRHRHAGCFGAQRPGAAPRVVLAASVPGKRQLRRSPAEQFCSARRLPARELTAHHPGDTAIYPSGSSNFDSGLKLAPT